LWVTAASKNVTGRQKGITNFFQSYNIYYAKKMTEISLSGIDQMGTFAELKTRAI